MKNLEFPKSIKLAEPQDVPKSREILDRIEEGKKATFTEGFTLKEVDPKSSLFSFFAEINIDNSSLWDLLLELSNELPEVCACIFGYESGEPKFGDYKSKSVIIEKLTEFKKELTEDCFLDFGLIFRTDTELVEVFVPNAKYIQFWGYEKANFLAIMARNKLNQFETLSFVDEFPKVVFSLNQLDETVRSTEEVIDALCEAFLDPSEEE